jgi:hypothetical protein
VTGPTGATGATGSIGVTGGSIRISFTDLQAGSVTGGTGDTGVSKTKALWLSGFEQLENDIVGTAWAYMRPGGTNWEASVGTFTTSISSSNIATYNIYYQYTK